MTITAPTIDREAPIAIHAGTRFRLLVNDQYFMNFAGAPAGTLGTVVRYAIVRNDPRVMVSFDSQRDRFWVGLDEIEILPQPEQTFVLADLYDADKRRRNPMIAKLASTHTIPHPLNNTVYAAPKRDGELSSRGTAVSPCRHAKRHKQFECCNQEVRWES
ncbi:MAG TPA: hypothetical protein VFU07_05080 [Candidatus Lumbricidophila sp.]|nr:hypothetical protein [Candidatus Lumbricidophila sp.]